MKTLRIIFYNTALKMTSKERIEELLKNFFWQEGQEPDDWNDFDGEIEVKTEQDLGGDCATIKVSDKWAQWTLDHLRKQEDVRSVEILYTDESKDFVLENRSQFEFDTFQQEAKINQFV